MPVWKRHVIFLLLSQGISILGSTIVQYALVWHITLTTKSGSMIALATACAFLPALVVSPIAGIWADRYNRRILIVVSDMITALATLAIMIAFIMGNQSIILMLLVMAIRGAAGGVQAPANNALLPGFVPTDQLRRVNGLLSMINSLSSVLGPALGGVVMVFWPLYWVFAIDLITALIGISLFWFFVDVPAYGAGAEDADHWHQDLFAGLRYVHHHQFFPVLFSFIAISILALSGPIFLLNLHVARLFGPEAWRLSIIETAFGIGGILGGGAVAVWTGFHKEITTISWALIIMALTVIGLGLCANFPGLTIIIGGLGVIFTYLNAPFLALIQRTCDPRHLGKVNSLLVMINTALLPFGMLFFGPLSDRVPIWTIMMLGGSLQLLIGVAMLFHPRLRAVPVAETSD